VPDDPLDHFHAAPGDRAEELLRACNAAPSLAPQLAAGRPYPSLDGLAARAEAAASRREQNAMGSAAESVAAAIAEGDRAYEERFGHVFLIRAAGRTAEEMLAELRRRLGNSEEERAEVTGQLAQITKLRAKGLMDR
jgi:2-oxo-4-hydroxy-4-carboxy-5-ureidoimidazoline decarboxylase